MEEKRLLTENELEMVSGGYKNEYNSELAGLVKYGIVSMEDISSGPITTQVLEKANAGTAFR